MLKSAPEWWQRNAQTVNARLEPVRALADGVVYHAPNSEQDVLVFKEKGILYMYFHADLAAEVQSRMQLDAPLHLLSPYSQLAMLGLLWQPQPARVYIIGLGGGRIPLYLHHVLPDATIVSAEIDPEVIKAARFFGLQTDSRLQVRLREGRKLLAEQPAGQPFDIIMMDAFLGTGGGPRALATVEFYALCRQHLSPTGILIVNLLPDDHDFAAKEATLRAAFTHVWRIVDPDRGNTVYIAHNHDAPSYDDLQQRAREVATAYDFTFPLTEHAGRLAYMHLNPLQVPKALLHDAAVQGAVKQGRNDACYCGSGKKFKKCHGAA